MTFDLETGLPLLSFEYDDNNNLTTIVDQFGDRVTINRAFGVSIARNSGDSLLNSPANEEFTSSPV